MVEAAGRLIPVFRQGPDYSFTCVSLKIRRGERVVDFRPP